MKQKKKIMKMKKKKKTRMKPQTHIEKLRKKTQIDT
jgi:hypothetical protein